MADRNPDPRRPPPLPATVVSPPRPVGMAHVKAFLAIRRLQVRDAWRRLAGRVRRRPVLASAAAAAVALAAGLAAAVALDLVPELDLGIGTPETVAEATERARTHPDSAAAQRDLGHVLSAAKKPRAALVAYGNALRIDPGVADERMIGQLLASYGTRDQPVAEALITKHKLVAADEGLQKLTRSRQRRVRWGAVQTLDRLERGKKTYWETAYILDLDSPDCEVRRGAVRKLGEIGTRRAIAALHEARREDEQTGGWLRSRCLGDRLEEAEQKIVARR